MEEKEQVDDDADWIGNRFGQLSHPGKLATPKMTPDESVNSLY